jgi:rhamnopyranosyl-N-acetylglucosaminyl-diphospho-decaprenol beta-1,3/1,4-galactofuranosyltransferase
MEAVTRVDIRLFAVVATYLRPEVATRAVQVLLAQSRPPDGIVLVENSPDAAFEGVFDPAIVTVVRPGYNAGAAGGFGIGADVALDLGATHVMLVDDDCFLHADAVERVLANLRDRIPGAVTGPVVVGADGDTLVWEIPRPGGGWYRRRSELPEHPLPARDLAFHGITVSAEALRVAGGPRKDLFFGGPDVEFCLRLAAHGYTIFYCPDAVATHHEVNYRHFWFFGDRKVTAGTPGHRYYVLRNRLLMWRLYHRDPMTIGIGKVIVRELAFAVIASDRRRRLALLATAVRHGLFGDPLRPMENAVSLHE